MDLEKGETSGAVVVGVLDMVKPGDERRLREPPAPSNASGRHLIVASGLLEGGRFESQQRCRFIQSHDFGNLFAQRDVPEDQTLVGEVIADGFIDELPFALAGNGDRPFEATTGVDSRECVHLPTSRDTLQGVRAPVDEREARARHQFANGGCPKDGANAS